MRLLITGVHGLLGSNLARCLSAKGHTLIGNGRRASPPALPCTYLPGDLSDRAFAQRLVDEAKPGAIINCVGLADVNACEKDPDHAMQINVETARNLAGAAAYRSIRFLHISTDHLFSGTHPNWTEDDLPTPVNAYGRSKWEGEKAVLGKEARAAVIRTNFYGWSPSGHSPTFAEWLYTSLSQETPITLFTDYFFNSIEVSYLADALEEVLLSGYRGILNIGSSERSSKYDFGKEMAEVFKLSLKNVTAASFQPSSLQVPRPRDLSLSVKRFQKLFRSPLPSLRDGLQRLDQEHSMNKVNRS